MKKIFLTLLLGTAIMCNCTIAQTTTTTNEYVPNSYLGWETGHDLPFRLNTLENPITPMIIKNTGNIGINMLLPLEKLHVNGNVRISSLAGTGNRMVQANASGNLIPMTAGTATQVLLGTGVWGNVPGGGNNWSTIGNSGTTAGTNFIGTTDVKDLVFKTSGSERIRILSTGNVGIGLAIGTSPAEKLHIGGNVRISSLAGTGTRIVQTTVDGNLIPMAAGTASQVLLGTGVWGPVPYSGDNLGNHTTTQNLNLNNQWLSNDNTSQGLHIESTGDLTFLNAGVNGFQLQRNSRIPYRRGISLNDDLGGGTGGEFNFWIHEWQTSSFNFMRNNDESNTNFTNLMTINENGNVGIGTSSPQAILHLKTIGILNNPFIRLDMSWDIPGEYVLDPEGEHPEETIWVEGYTVNQNWEMGQTYKGLVFRNKNSVESQNFTERMLIKNNGFVGIGCTSPDEMLTVNGKIHVKEEIRVDLNGTWPDYVFNKDYSLLSLNEVEKFIETNNHLPNIPSADEVKEKGINLAAMNTELLKKIEELTLYLIKQDKVLGEQQIMINELKEKTSNLEKIINQ